MATGVASPRATHHLPEMVELAEGFQGGARLAGHDEERAAHVKAVADRLDGRRIGGVEDVEGGVTARAAEGLAQDLRAEAAAPHAEEHRVTDALSTTPWSWKASMVLSGMVSTVSGPTRASAYTTSR